MIPNSITSELAQAVTISVIFPVFNAAPFLDEAVSSILSQTWKEFELLAIDDGSTDSSLQILQDFAARDPRVRILINESNKGLIHTLNRGLSECRGEFIVRQDADDVSLPERFAEQLDFLMTHPEVGVVGSAMEVINASSRKLEVYTLPESDASIRFRLLFNNAFTHTSVMFRKSLCLSHSIQYDDRFLHAEDYDFWIRILSISSGYNFKKPLVRHRIHPGSISNRNSKAQEEIASRISAEQLRQLGLTSAIPWESRRRMLDLFMRFVWGKWGSVSDADGALLHTLRDITHRVLERFSHNSEQLKEFESLLIDEIQLFNRRRFPGASTLPVQEACDFSFPEASYQRTPATRPAYGMQYRGAPGEHPPAVTVITPFFNTGPVFHETATSLFLQSLQQFEWLIVNDGSSDVESISVLERYRASDPRIRVIDHPQNLGLAAARNTGFREARAEWVFQLDSDDLLEPTALEKCAWFLHSHPSYSFAKGYTIGFGAENYLWRQGFEQTERFLENNPITPTAMIRRSVHQAVGGYDESWRMGFEDWEFWLRCAERGYWGATIPEYFDWYRRRADHADRWLCFKKENRDRLRGDLIEKYATSARQGLSLFYRKPADVFGAPSESNPFQNKLSPSKRRLLFLLPWFAVGGAEKVNLDALRLLTRDHGWEVTVCATLDNELDWMPRFAEFTQDIFVLPHFLRIADRPRFLAYLIESRQYDACLLTCSKFSYQIVPYLRARFKELPILDLLHLEEPWGGGGYPSASIERRACLDLTITISQHLRRWMIDHDGDPDRIEVCYANADSVDAQSQAAFRNAVREEFGVDKDTPLILFAGRLVDQKRPRVVAEVMLGLKAAGLRFKCVMAGDGPELEWLRNFAEEKQLSELLLLGVQSQQQVARLMAGADILFLPSVHEGIALVCYEAMAAGLPIVCSDVGGQTELVTPDCGIAIKPGPGERLAYMLALASLINDSEGRLRMGTAARDRVRQHFRLEDMGRRMVALIDRAIHLRRTAPRELVTPEEGRASLLKYFAKAKKAGFVTRLWGRSERLGDRRSQMARIQKEDFISALRGYLRRRFERLLIACDFSILRIR